MAYHGTKNNVADLVLASGLKTGGGCYAGRDLVVYVSPSIEYSAHRRYAAPWKNPETGKYHQMIFQCRVNPSSLNSQNVCAETLLKPDKKGVQIDPNFSNNELEWVIRPSTAEKAVGYISNDIVCYGIMMRTTDGMPEDLPASRWWKDAYC